MKDDTQKQRDTVLSDEEIVELYWERNETAISETDVKYGKYLFAVAYNVLHDRLDCEETVNDTYLGTWNNIPPQRPSVFQVFLSRITRNIAIDKYRHTTAEKRIPSELTLSLDELEGCFPFSSPSVEEEILIKDLGRVLNQCVRDLPEREKFAFVCRYYYADSITSIARMLTVNERTVFRDLSNAREKLKKLLKEAGFDYE